MLVCTDVLCRRATTDDIPALSNEHTSPTLFLISSGLSGRKKKDKKKKTNEKKRKERKEKKRNLIEVASALRYCWSLPWRI